MAEVNTNAVTREFALTTTAAGETITVNTVRGGVIEQTQSLTKAQINAQIASLTTNLATLNQMLALFTK